MLDLANEEAQNILNGKIGNDTKVFNAETRNVTLIEINELPSNFKGYPEGTKISYEPLTLGELEALNSSDNIDVQRGMAMLLKSIHCNTLSVENLYYWDVIYIGIRRKLLAFGDTLGTLYERCPVCGEIVQKEFSYTELEFKQPNAPDLPIFLDIQGQELEFNLITIKDFLEIEIEKGELDVFARMIKNLPYEQAFELVSSCSGTDLRKIKFIDKETNYGLKPFFVECNGIIETKSEQGENKKELCKNKVRMEVRSPFEVVFPENIDFGHNEFQVRYGKK